MSALRGWEWVWRRKEVNQKASRPGQGVRLPGQGVRVNGHGVRTRRTWCPYRADKVSAFLRSKKSKRGWVILRLRLKARKP